MVHLQKEDESEERNRASFPRWGKLRVISCHFTELVFKITEMGMLAAVVNFLEIVSVGRVDLR